MLFSLFLLFLKGSRWKYLTLIFCVIPAVALYSKYIKVIILESNVAQIFELILAIVKENYLPTYLENNINAILKSHSNLFMGR